MPWYDKYLSKPPPPEVPRLPPEVAAKPAGDPQAARYAQGALRRACDNIANAPEGTRNHTLNAESWSIGQLVKAGHLDAEATQNELEMAGLASGLPLGEVRATVPHSIGDAEPRDVRLDPDYAPVEASAEGIAFTPQAATQGPRAAPQSKQQGTTEKEGGDEDITPEEARAWRREQAIQIEVDRLEVQDEARRRRDSNLTEDVRGKIQAPIPLGDFLNIADPPITWVLEGLQPVGTRALLAAQAKAGKTTMVANLIKALADQEAFLGDFLNHFDGTITLIDDELDERMLRRWLKRLNINRPERVRVVPLKGRLSTFNIVDDEIRERWVQELQGADYLILDCLRPALDASGLDENHEAGIFLNAFDELMADAGIDSGLVVHHMGHSATRSRGDSRIMDWPDALWKLTRADPDNPASKRSFSAFGREVDVKETPLHHTDGLLVLEGDEGARWRSRTDPKGWVIESWFREAGTEPQPKRWWEDLARTEAESGRSAPSRNQARQAVTELASEGVLIEEAGERHPKYSPDGDSDFVIEIVTGA